MSFRLLTEPASLKRDAVMTAWVAVRDQWFPAPHRAGLIEAVRYLTHYSQILQVSGSSQSRPH